MAGLGVVCLIAFAFALTRVDSAFAGRAYAYIAGSLVRLWLIEGQAPTRTDLAGAALAIAGAVIIIAFGARFAARRRRKDCPQDCPCELPKPGLRSQQQPSRWIEEVIETRGFARKNDDGRNADRRLANRRLQPLGHLTADCKYTTSNRLCEGAMSPNCP